MARGHVSAAWTLTFFMFHNHMLARFPLETQEIVFADGPTLTTGLIHLPRQAEAVDGGYLVTGRWYYATGITHADWVIVLAVVDGELPRPMLFVVPKHEVEVQETWNMSGVRGTGSHDVILDHLFVPEHMATDFESWASRSNPGSLLYPETLFRYAIFDTFAFVFAALGLGAAEAVVEEYRATIERRLVPFGSQVIADTVPGHIRYARVLSALQVAEATLERSVDLTMEANERTDEELDPVTRGKLTLNVLSVLRVAAESVELSVRGAGSSIFKTDSPVHHFMRDLEIVRSHMALDEDTVLSKTGEVLLGRGGAFSGSEIIRQS